MRGSPPRVWGQLLVVKFHWHARSVHPHACGDNGFFNVMKYTDGPVHPHACGDNPRFLLGPGPQRGSPPRVWGQPPTGTQSTASRPVHPHACGDNAANPSKPRPGCGSPPRVWGQRCGRGSGAGGRTVHPHACGDNPPYLFPLPLPSPLVHPHACGDNDLLAGSLAAILRFTPTRVGTTKNRGL